MAKINIILTYLLMLGINVFSSLPAKQQKTYNSDAFKQLKSKMKTHEVHRNDEDEKMQQAIVSVGSRNNVEVYMANNASLENVRNTIRNFLHNKRSSKSNNNSIQDKNIWSSSDNNLAKMTRIFITNSNKFQNKREITDSDQLKNKILKLHFWNCSNSLCKEHEIDLHSTLGKELFNITSQFYQHLNSLEHHSNKRNKTHMVQHKKRKTKRVRKIQSVTVSPTDSATVIVYECVKKSVHIPNISNKPLHTPNNSKEPLYTPNNFNEPLHIPNDSNEPSHIPNNSNEPSHIPNNSNEPSHIPNNSNEPSHIPNNSNEPSHIPNNSNEPSHIPNNSNKPSYIPTNSNNIESVTKEGKTNNIENVTLSRNSNFYVKKNTTTCSPKAENPIFITVENFLVKPEICNRKLKTEGKSHKTLQKFADNRDHHRNKKQSTETNKKAHTYFKVKEIASQLDKAKLNNQKDSHSVDNRERRVFFNKIEIPIRYFTQRNLNRLKHNSKFHSLPDSLSDSELKRKIDFQNIIQKGKAFLLQNHIINLSAINDTGNITTTTTPNTTSVQSTLSSIASLPRSKSSEYAAFAPTTEMSTLKMLTSTTKASTESTTTVATTTTTVPTTTTVATTSTTTETSTSKMINESRHENDTKININNQNNSLITTEKSPNENDTLDENQTLIVDIKSFLTNIDEQISKAYNSDALAQWKYESNITDESRQQAMNSALELASFRKDLWKVMKDINPDDYQDPQIKRQLMMVGVLDETALPEEKYKELEGVQKNMINIYSTATICSYKNQSQCGLELEPDITNIMDHSHDPEELKHAWVNWHRATGQQMKKLYPKYVELLTDTAKLNNFSDIVEEWLNPYEDPYFRRKVIRLWKQLRPLYVQLHSHVRQKLREFYGEDVVPLKGCIPAHLLGNIWGQSWENIYNISLPYPLNNTVDITAEMLKQGFTPLKMFQEADRFFQSLGLIALPQEFWKNSIIEKPKQDTKMVCHASAWDMYDQKDFRIKMCTQVTLKDFITIHHELGHVQYFMQYKNLPFVFRDGANPGFHEAIGDVMALSVSTPKHMKEIGILSNKNEKPDYKEDLNFLYSIALQKISFLPYALVVDMWRWDVFQGRVKPEDYNNHWWKLRKKMEGISPPIERTNDDFDPGGKYHVAAGVPYLRYFVSFVIQFQFHQALCQAAEQYDPRDEAKYPLHRCDIYNSKKAGENLRQMLQMGSAYPWPYAMKVLTGQWRMDVNGMLDYFKPLSKWLEDENDEKNEQVGWESHC